MISNKLQFVFLGDVINLLAICLFVCLTHQKYGVDAEPCGMIVQLSPGVFG